MRTMMTVLAYKLITPSCYAQIATGPKRDWATPGAVTLIQRFGTAANVSYTENSSAPVTDINWPDTSRRLGPRYC